MARVKSAKLLAELRQLAEQQVILFTPKKMYIEDVVPTRDFLGSELDILSHKYASPDPSVPMILKPICDASGAAELLNLTGNRYWFWTLVLTALRRGCTLPLTGADVRDAALGLAMGFSVNYRTAQVIYDSNDKVAATKALKKLFKGHGLLLAVSQGFVLIQDELMAETNGPPYQLNPVFDALFAARAG